MFSQRRSLAADSESTGQQTIKQPPGFPLQAQFKKVASTGLAALATIGARPSLSGARLVHEFPRSFLVVAIIFPHTKWLNKSQNIVTLPL